MPLHAWWSKGYEAFVEAFSALSPDDPASVFRGVLSRNGGRIVHSTELDTKGRLFTPTCSSLGAACYLLGLDLLS
jgi:hypothetical protein